MTEYGTRWVLGGGEQTPEILVSMMKLQRDGLFPLDPLVRFHDLADINRAIDDGDSGEAVKPSLRMGALSPLVHSAP